MWSKMRGIEGDHHVPPPPSCAAAATVLGAAGPYCCQPQGGSCATTVPRALQTFAELLPRQAGRGAREEAALAQRPELLLSSKPRLKPKPTVLLQRARRLSADICRAAAQASSAQCLAQIICLCC